MTQKEFLARLTNSQEDILKLFLDLLAEQKIDYCVIGGLGVNAYVEPVASLDLDVVITAKKIEHLKKAAHPLFDLKEFEHSLNLKSTKSDLRIQIQSDPRYQDFLATAEMKNILGYQMQVASLENILKGKLWAYSDGKRRKSKRQKDLADIFRIVESYPKMLTLLPESIREKL